MLGACARRAAPSPEAPCLHTIERSWVLLVVVLVSVGRPGVWCAGGGGCCAGCACGERPVRARGALRWICAVRCAGRRSHLHRVTRWCAALRCAGAALARGACLTCPLRLDLTLPRHAPLAAILRRRANTPRPNPLPNSSRHAPQLKQYTVVGRRLPSEAHPKPTLYKMTIFAPNEVHAKSRFWYFLSKLKKLKKANGEILGVREVGAGVGGGGG